MANLRETFADVAALIPRYSWEIMDEAQRDDLMASVVLPRYMKTTADGVQLGPTAWAEMVGASPAAVKNRIHRLQASQRTPESAGARAHWTQGAREQRNARAVLREADDETLAEIIAALPADKVEAVALAAHARQIETIRESGDEAAEAIKFADYMVAREKFGEIDRSWLLITEMNVAIGRVHVAGLEDIISRATPAQRREIAERWPDHIALLQHGIDLAKTSTLRAVKSRG